MKLSTRLILAYGYLGILVLIVAGSATIGFFDLGGGIERILRDNVESLESTTRMLEALERQDSATLTTLLEPSEGRQALEEADAEFSEALAQVSANITGDGEGQIIDGLRENYRQYQRARSDLLEDVPTTAPLEAYQTETFPRFKAVKEDVLALLTRNQQAIAAADRQAQSKAIQYGSWLGFLVVVTLLSFVFLTRGLRRWVLERIDEIRDVAEAVAAGATRRRVRVRRDDELGVIGRQLNHALDQYQELERNIEGQTRERKQQLLGLLHVGYTDAALFGLDGQLIATSFQEPLSDQTNACIHAAIDEQRERVELPDGREVRLERVETRQGRGVGWLVERINGSG